MSTSEPPTSSTIFYQSLEPDEIRLLRVEPGDSDVISCQLHNVKLATNPDFWALSYVWGPREDPRTVLINGSPFLVTINLYHALVEYRRQFLGKSEKNASTYIWIDAICINQDDLLEKAIQVPRMTYIYGRCEHVLAWLGPVNDEESGNIRKLAAKLNEFEFPTDSSSKARTTDSRIDAFRDSGHSDQQAAAEVECVRQALKTIGRRPWFRRIWIIQEAVLAQQPPILLCGPHIMGYDIFFRTWVNMLNPDHDGQLLYTFANDPVRYMAVEGVYKKILQNRRKIPLSEATANKERQCASDILELFNETTDLGATIPHDRLYALLGLVDCNPLPTALQPDYQKEFQRLCHDFTVFVLEKAQDVRVLNLGTLGNLADVPSWTPDLRNNWMARANIKSCPGKCYHLSADGQVLTMPAIILGRCISVSSPLHPDPTTQSVPLSGFMEFDRVIIQVASAIRNKTRMEVMAEWLRPHLANLYSEERLDQDPSIEQRVMMAYTCMVHNQPLGALGLRFGSKEQLEGADGMVRNPNFQEALVGHSTFVLQDGTAGDVVGRDTSASVGDALCVFPGISNACLIRPREDGKCRLVGQASLWKFIGANLPGDLLESYRLSFVDAHHSRESKHEVRQVSLI